MSQHHLLLLFFGGFRPSAPPGSILNSQIQIPNVLPVAGRLLVGELALLALAALMLLLLRARRRRRSTSAPLPATTVPILKSPDDRLHFRLDRLTGAGLVIGRGRHGVDLKIDESVPHADTVSERHARIYHDPTCGYVVIEDLGSTNGIFINGRRAPRKNLLKDGWVVGLGEVTLTYRDGESDTGPLD